MRSWKVLFGHSKLFNPNKLPVIKRQNDLLSTHLCRWRSSLAPAGGEGGGGTQDFK